MTQDPNMPPTGGTPPPVGGTPPPIGGMPPVTPVSYESANLDPASVPPDARTLGMLSFILAIFGPLCWVGPLIIYLTKKDTSPFVRDQAAEALNWALTILIGFIIGIATSCLFIGILINIALGITNLIFCILGAIKANQGIRYRMPFSIKFVK